MNYYEFLDELKSSGQIEPLDYHLALFSINQSNLTEYLDKKRLAFLIIWLSIEVRSGHVCINLDEISAKNIEYKFGYDKACFILEKLSYPADQDWHILCHNISNELISDGSQLSPFVLQKNHFYFQRMWFYEKSVAEFFKNNHETYEVTQTIKQLLNELFPEQIGFFFRDSIQSKNTFTINKDNEIDWQKIAVACAVTRKITIISGGPGTGKTTTVSKILAAFVGNHQHTSSEHLRIVAAAPTGKASARLTESLSNAISNLPVSDRIKQNIPIEAVTLHRLLGARIEKNKYINNKENPLDIDILLIDEASMVDLTMMNNVILALPKNAKLILLGDKEQLSSVESGAIFSDLCTLTRQGYSRQYTETIKDLTGYCLDATRETSSISDNICLLQKSYRFNDQSGIGIFANLIKNGQSNHAITLLENKTSQDIDFYSVESYENYHTSLEMFAKSYSSYWNTIKENSQEIRKILFSFEKFRLLCALREGPFGVHGLNESIEKYFQEKKWIDKKEIWYVGRPIMILKNNNHLGLFNGDIGITLPNVDDSTKLSTYFLMPNGEIKGFSPSLLPEHETAYAMTIHKSQGSEFDNVSIILPNEYSPLLTRSLLYTAVTRAKKKVTIFSTTAMIKMVINSKNNRKSGLVELLSE